MADPNKGKFVFLLYILLFFGSARRTFASTEHDAAPVQELAQRSFDVEHTSQLSVEASPQEALLSRLEELVKNLTDIVSRLEPILLAPRNQVVLERKAERGSEQSTTKVNGIMEDRTKTGDGESSGTSSKQSPFWSDRFQLVSAVKVNSHATCINVLPFRDHEGQSKYIAVGDDRGKVYLFLRNGDAVVDFYTECDSPITAMVSYLSSNKNESFVVTGHENGAIMMNKVSDRSAVEELNSFSMENVGRLSAPADNNENCAVNVLEVHHVGRSRYILSSDASGKMKAFKENGTFHGSAMPKSKPLAFLKQKLLFLTESGAGSLDLRNMKIRESECEGLNHSLSHTYVFDAVERSKAYGYTSDGDLIHVLLLGDIMNFKCRVRSKRKFDMGSPLALQTIKGYLLVTNHEKVFVFNVSSHHYVRVGGPRHLYSVDLNEIRLSFLNNQTDDSSLKAHNLMPLAASDRDKFFILTFDCRYVVTFRSNLPVFKGELNTMLWTSPVLFFLIFLFGAWQFFAKKKEALTAWGPDDPFTTSPSVTGAPLSTPPDDTPPFMESSSASSRNTDLMDLRPGAITGPARRYGSPPGFSGAAAPPYRPSVADSNIRPTSLDQSFRPSPELKYRGPSLESAGFPKRREGLFINNHVGDNNNH